MNSARSVTSVDDPPSPSWSSGPSVSMNAPAMATSLLLGFIHVNAMAESDRFTATCSKYDISRLA
jgi:hypothetical protein